MKLSFRTVAPVLAAALLVSAALKPTPAEARYGRGGSILGGLAVGVMTAMIMKRAVAAPAAGYVGSRCATTNYQYGGAYGSPYGGYPATGYMQPGCPVAVPVAPTVQRRTVVVPMNGSGYGSYGGTYGATSNYGGSYGGSYGRSSYGSSSSGSYGTYGRSSYGSTSGSYRGSYSGSRSGSYGGHRH